MVGVLRRRWATWLGEGCERWAMSFEEKRFSNDLGLVQK